MAKSRGIRKANSRTLRTAGQFTPAGCLVLILEAFTNFNKLQVMAVFATATLATGYVQNYLEGRANKHLLEDATAETESTAYRPEA